MQVIIAEKNVAFASFIDELDPIPCTPQRSSFMRIFHSQWGQCIVRFSSILLFSSTTWILGLQWAGKGFRGKSAGFRYFECSFVWTQQIQCRLPVHSWGPTVELSKNQLAGGVFLKTQRFTFFSSICETCSGRLTRSDYSQLYVTGSEMKRSGDRLHLVLILQALTKATTPIR